MLEQKYNEYLLIFKLLGVGCYTAMWMIFGQGCQLVWKWPLLWTCAYMSLQKKKWEASPVPTTLQAPPSFVSLKINASHLALTSSAGYMVHACRVNDWGNEKNVLLYMKQCNLTEPPNLAARSFVWNGTHWAWEWIHNVETEMARLMLLTHHAKAWVLWSQNILSEERDHRFLPRNPVSDTWGESAMPFGSVIPLGFIGFLLGTTVVNKSTNTSSHPMNEFLREKVFQFCKIMENALKHWSSNLLLLGERIDEPIN